MLNPYLTPCQFLAGTEKKQLNLDTEKIQEDCVKWKRQAAHTVYFSHHFLEAGESWLFGIYCVPQFNGVMLCETVTFHLLLLLMSDPSCASHMIYLCCLKAAEESTVLSVFTITRCPEVKTDNILNFSYEGILTEEAVILVQIAGSGTNAPWPLR